MTYDTDAINNIKFTQGFRGYDTAEVDEFLDDMIREIEKLNNTIKNIKDEVAKEKRKNQLNQQEIERLTEMNESLSVDGKIVPKEAVNTVVEPKPIKITKAASIEDIKGTPEYEEMKQILTDTLLSAQQHAEKLVKDAQQRAETLIEEGEIKAKDKVVTLNSEINNSQAKLDAITAMVLDAKQRFKRKFQDQIAALDSIIIENVEADEVEASHFDDSDTEKDEEIVVDRAQSVISMSNIPSLDNNIGEKIEEKKNEATPTNVATNQDVNAFDFAAVKKSLLKENEQGKEKSVVKNNTVDTASKDSSSDIEEDNKQYIELAMSTYNDNKHHNTDYPKTPANIKINEDDEDGGIYQPENRSVLSSVIEEILNNKRNED